MRLRTCTCAGRLFLKGYDIMEQWLNIPFTLRLKVFLILLMGIGSLIIAAVVFFISRDRLLLILSGIIFGCCLFRSTGLLILVLRGDYETITGICTAVSSQPLRRYHKIELTDSQGAAIILLLGKQVKIKPGGCYRFYFRKAPRPSLGSEYLDASLSTDLFLGYDSSLPENESDKKEQGAAES